MPEQTFKRELESLIVDLIKKYDQLGMRASGNWARMLEQTVNRSAGKLTGTIRGASYTKNLVEGVPPGSSVSVAAIEKWIQAKNINVYTNLRTAAYFISKKIEREGTEYFNQGGTDLIDGVITSQRLEEIVQVVGNGILKDIQVNYISRIKEAIA